MRTMRLSLLALLVLALGVSAQAPEAPTDRYGDPLPRQALARLGTIRFRQPGGWGARLLGFTPDGKTLVSGGGGDVRVWEADTGRLVRTIAIRGSSRGGFALSRDGKLAAAVGSLRQPGKLWQGVVAVYRVADGKEVRAWIRDSNERSDSYALAFSADGSLLASLNGGGQFRLEEVETGAELLKHQFPRDYAGEIAFSPDGEVLAVASGPNARKVYLWRWKDGGDPGQLPMSDAAQRLSFSPDGKVLATGDHQGGTRLWDVASSKQIRLLDRNRSITRLVRFAPDGKHLVTSNHGARGLILWDAATGKEVRTLPGLSHEPVSAYFSPDSRRLATIEDGAIRILDVESGKETPTFPDTHAQPPSFLRLLKDGTAVTAGDDGTVRFWEARTGKQTRHFDLTRDWVRAAALSPDGRWLAASEMGETQCISLWDLNTGKRIYRLAGHGQAGGKRTLAFTPDSKRLASWGDDHYLRLWDIKTGKAVEEHIVHPDGKAGLLDEEDDRKAMTQMLQLQGGTLSTDARLFALGYSSSLFIFDVASGKQTAKLQHQDGHIGTMRFTPDGKSLLVSAWGKSRLVEVEGRQRLTTGDPAVCIHDIAKGVERVRVSFPGEHLSRAALAPDGKRFAVAVSSPASCIRVFDVDGKPRGKIDLPDSPRSLAFADDGKHILASLGDATVLILPVPTK